MKLLVKPLAIIFYLKELLVKNWKFIQWPTYLTLGVGIFSIFLGSVVWEMYFSAIQFVLQLAMMLGFAIIQFVGIFWFMSRTRLTEILPGDPKTMTMDDYVGQPELKKTIEQWVHLIRNRTEFQKIGGRLISGILLTGKAGVGKSHLAKCLAGSSNIAFLGTEGSSFKAMFFGVSTLKIMALFSKARKLAEKYGSCIIFIDEIDSIGAARAGMGGGGMGMMGGGGELTRLLYEMDGLVEQSTWQKCYTKASILCGEGTVDWGHVLVMGSTNLPQALDTALKRPGRFDLIVEVDVPDQKGRLDIIAYYLKKVINTLTEDERTYLSEISGFTTPVHLMSAITKDSVRLAVFDGRKSITLKDIETALQEQIVGLPNPITNLQEEQKWQIAVHEASHAVAQYKLLGASSRIVRLSIIRRTNALGYMLPIDKQDVYALPLSNIIRRIMVSVAGHVGTELILGEVWSGASGDFGHIRMLMQNLIMYGMFGTFPLSENGPSVQEKVDVFFKRISDKTRELLDKNRDMVVGLAKALLENGDMNGADVYAVINQYEATDETTHTELPTL